MGDIITLFKKPKLKNPCLIAAWPGMGNVAMRAVGYLKDQLGVRPLGEVDPSDFFAPTGAIVVKQVIQSLDPPSNRFFYYQTSLSERDIIFFIGNIQPIPHKEYEFALEILKVAKIFGVKTVYTTAAAPTDMHFKDTPRIFAVPNHPGMLNMLSKYDVHFMGDGNIAGLNGLFISVAASMGIRGICFLGEIPFFTAQIEYPKASLKILEVLTKILSVKIDLLDLELYANQKEKEIEPLAALLVRDNPETGISKEEKEIPEQEEKIPRSVRLKIEKLFRQAEFDKTYKSKMKLKEELDKWELFDEYIDRFLDLFKKGHGESGM